MESLSLLYIEVLFSHPSILFHFSGKDYFQEIGVQTTHNKGYTRTCCTSSIWHCMWTCTHLHFCAGLMMLRFFLADLVMRDSWGCTDVTFNGALPTVSGAPFLLEGTERCFFLNTCCMIFCGVYKGQKPHLRNSPWFQGQSYLVSIRDSSKEFKQLPIDWSKKIERCSFQNADLLCTNDFW